MGIDKEVAAKFNKIIAFLTLLSLVSASVSASAISQEFGKNF